MPRVAKACLQTSMKTMNSIMAMVGIAMILYSLWMIRAWQRDIIDDGSSSFFDVVPWFIYSFLGIGITLCVIACFGHVAAHTANCFCLSCYTVIMFLLLLLEIAAAADIFLNSDWEKDLPEDPTGRFDDFKDFVDSNFENCQWIVFLIILAQGILILIAIVLRTLEPENGPFYDSDDEFAQPRLPFLNHPVQPPQYIVGGDPHFAFKHDSWNSRIHEKVDTPFNF